MLGWHTREPPPILVSEAETSERLPKPLTDVRRSHKTLSS